MNQKLEKSTLIGETYLTLQKMINTTVLKNNLFYWNYYFTTIGVVKNNPSGLTVSVTSHINLRIIQCWLASDEKDWKSISGCCFYCISLVSWLARKQWTVSTSSTESRYHALANTMKEAIWLELFFLLIQLYILHPLRLLCDNQSTRAIATTNAFLSCSKHIDIISSRSTSQMACFHCIGHQHLTWSQIFLPNHYLLFFFNITVTILVLLLLDFFFFHHRHFPAGDVLD
jgi:hypothetical protein